MFAVSKNLPIICTLASLLFCASCAPQAPKSAETCRPLGYTPEALLALKKAEFASLPDEQTSQMALALLSCLGDADPAMRDGVAYETLSRWLREEKLSLATIREVKARLMSDLLEQTPDGDGFLKPFAALVLSEVVRVDRVTPYLSDTERQEVVEAAITYFTGITDYRGFDDEEGWRHAIAHTADIFLQLALNPEIGDADLVKMRNAIALQVSPANGHAYLHGESERLARPILFMVLRDDFSNDGWEIWLKNVTDPAPMVTWNEAFSSEAGLAKRHNVTAFINALYINTSASKNERLLALVPSLTEALQKLP